MRKDQCRPTHALIATALACASSLVNAQGLTNFSGRDPGVQDIIRALKPAPAMPSGPAPTVRTRAIKFFTSEGAQTNASRHAEIQAPADTLDEQPNDRARSTAPARASFDQIQFQFDSAELTAQARRMLDRIGEALGADELRGLRFAVEGHTDAVGPDQYNLTLSQRRANSVSRYLSARHGVPANMLKAIGKGESELLDDSQPANPANRRVVIGVLP
jgi:outer membrane protein OmpA-like peptidoglycan-associated protein